VPVCIKGIPLSPSQHSLPPERWNQMRQKIITPSMHELIILEQSASVCHSLVCIDFIIAVVINVAVAAKNYLLQQSAQIDDVLLNIYDLERTARAPIFCSKCDRSFS
jgi:hypothetical protein